MCTDMDTEPIQIIQWYLRRWRIEVTFQEVRAHLGVETQRQWSDRAIARTTPLLLGLFSWVTLVAGPMQQGNSDPPRSCPWYAKCEPNLQRCDRPCEERSVADLGASINIAVGD